MHNLHVKVLLTVVILPCLAGCTGARLERASTSYKSARDYDSLKYIAERLHQGMPRAEVEALLGSPDYSPIDGLCYYASDKRERIEQEDESPGEGPALEAVAGLVVTYRADGRVTGYLQSFWFGHMGE